MDFAMPHNFQRWERGGNGRRMQRKRTHGICRKSLKFLVPRDRIELPTRGFSVFFIAIFAYFLTFPFPA